MPMPRDEHEALLNELLSADLETSRRTEILQLLRNDYGTVLSDDDSHKTRIDKLEKDNADLVISNSKLFRELGTTNQPEKKEDEQKKEFSETVTIEQLEKGV